MKPKYCMVLTTVNSDVVKKAVIEAILKKRLAACIQCLNIQSSYVWDGKIREDNEQLLIMKTTKAGYAELEKTICQHHDYDVPQVIQVPITDGFDPYLSWIDNSTR
jgi:periplasmic divalent cation tolerance protein